MIEQNADKKQAEVASQLKAEREKTVNLEKEVDQLRAALTDNEIAFNACQKEKSELQDTIKQQVEEARGELENVICLKHRIALQNSAGWTSIFAQMRHSNQRIPEKAGAASREKEQGEILRGKNRNVET